MMKNKPHKNMLNKRDPKIDFWGNPNKISSQEMHAAFVLVLCLWFAKVLYQC